MTSRLSQRATSILAALGIVLLLGLIIFLWAGVHHGIFKPDQRPKAPPQHAGLAPALAQPPPSPAVSPPQDVRRRPLNQPSKTFVPTDNGGRDKDVEFVKPIKTSPQPLHEQDIIFEQSKYGPRQDPRPSSRHHSGHFRHRTASIWDPHPEYNISAFGRIFHLLLRQDSSFVSSDILLTNFWKSYMVKVNPESKPGGCFYSGRVAGDPTSSVAVSLCHGMTGYIRTADQTYYIEPVEQQTNHSAIKTILHAIRHVNDPNSVQDTVLDHSCDTADGHSHANAVDQETNETDEHQRTKRYASGRRLLSIGRQHPDYYAYHQRPTSRQHYGRYRYDGYQQHHPHHQQQQQQQQDHLNRLQDDVNFSEQSDELDRDSLDNRRKRNGNQEYVVEVLIVADTSMAEKHRTEENLRQYILTLMSHVALLFKNDTIGNPITISVVGIVNLKDDTLLEEAKKQHDVLLSENLLETFCSWQKSNYTNLHSYDVALLLTRLPICRSIKWENCNVLGVANEASMCKSDGCAVVRDNGLGTSFTIAHELGHVLGMPHDSSKSCLNIHKNIPILGTMADKIGKNSNPWLWSPCAKHYLTEFLESMHSHCLLRGHPGEDFIFAKDIRLPGENISPDEQCKLIHGAGFTQCPGMSTCETLHCKAPTGECYWHYHSVADGTTCNLTHYQTGLCVQGQCKPFTSRIVDPINGGWGPYEQWSECSMSCGGGIKRARRNCNNPRPSHYGKYCTGLAVRYASCNAHPCPIHAQHRYADAREEQCTAHNGKNFNITGVPRNVTWVPKYGEPTCELFCRVENRSDYFQLARKVIDGTKCELNSFDICVNGICRKGGCDNLVDSNATLDACGNCGGDNSQCREIHETVTVNAKVDGYIDIVTIPRGSYHLNVSKINKLSNFHHGNYFFLAVKNETGGYIFNGNYTILQSRVVEVYGGVTLEYTGSEAEVERLNSTPSRPLDRELTIQVIKSGSDPMEITYSYYMRRNTQRHYMWILGNWTVCEYICEGKQYRYAICIEQDSQTHVHDHYCANHVKPPPMIQNCNQHCTLRWERTATSECSVTCGMGALHVYSSCVQIMIDHQRSIINESFCSHLQNDIPAIEICSRTCDSSQWVYDQWSACSKTCEKGVQTRQAHCVDRRGNPIPIEYCKDSEKEAVVQECSSGMCPQWIRNAWSQCTASCGTGVRSRQYWCERNGEYIKDIYCDMSSKPKTEEETCDTQRPCHVRWAMGDWKPCSVSCGNGVTQKEAFCQDVDTNKPVAEIFCKDKEKPVLTNYCSMPSCPVFHDQKTKIKKHIDDLNNNIALSDWTSGPWSECSASCGGGKTRRTVLCQDDLGMEADNCNVNLKPESSKACNTGPCFSWIYGKWSVCGSNCVQGRKVQCVDFNGTYHDDRACDNSKREAARQRCRSQGCQTQRNRNRHTYPKRGNNRGRTITPPVSVEKYEWIRKPWSRCSRTCGKGVQQRTVYCVEKSTQKQQLDTFCEKTKHKPKATRSCNIRFCEGYAWIDQPWTNCSHVCGPGLRTRTVSCHKVNKYGYVHPAVVERMNYQYGHETTGYCDMNTKPKNHEACLMQGCNDKYYWTTGRWSRCSQRCGKAGMKTRAKYCYDRNGNRVKNINCAKLMAPPIRRQQCRDKTCEITTCKELQIKDKKRSDGDFILNVHGKSVRIYCYGMNTASPTEYLPLPAHNYADYFKWRLKDPSECPARLNHETGDGIAIEEPGGLTSFKRIRLNITTLQVQIDDFTFTEQTGNRRMSYGTAGDCFSERSDCVRGTFSINLENTGLKVSAKTTWNMFKRKPEIIRQSPTSVIAYCGGCDICTPDSKYGLLLEVT